jgi:ribosomal protein L7Ae-like RNA K-turn-binding protein
MASNLYQKLIEVRKIVPYLKKDTKGYQYVYVKGSTVLGAIMEKMNDLNLLLVPKIVDHKTNMMGAPEKNKPTIDCTMIMTWINADNPTEQLDVPFVCVGTQDDISKALGSALTYSERYFLLKFFNIATDKDDPDSQQTKTADHKNVEKKMAASVSNGDTMIRNIVWALSNKDKEVYLKKMLDFCDGKDFDIMTKTEKSEVYDKVLIAKREADKK